MYEVKVHRDSLKAYRKLDRGLQERVDEAVEKLRADPWRKDLDVRKLHGEYAGYYRLRVGDVRVVFTVEHETRTILSTACPVERMLTGKPGFELGRGRGGSAR